jgi:hypothetical protein
MKLTKQLMRGVGLTYRWRREPAALGAAMDITPERFGQFIVGLLIALWAYATWSGIRSRKREVEGACPRCGAAFPTDPVGGVPFCERCAQATRSSTKFGYRFFLGMAIVGGILMTLGTLSDVWRGFPVDVQAVLPMFGWGVGAPLAIAFWIRRQTVGAAGTRDDHHH